MDTLTIDCDGCIMQGTDACSDCVVTFICDRAPEDALVFDAAEERALGMLGRSGLVPPIRHHLGHAGRSAGGLSVGPRAG
ncbi:MAG TPA: hypothetical protein VEJ84_20945 [Acidimicrobiales bacterium]|nr:hypothetical protein [Acidimicrobiales bacterium]